MNIRAAWKLGTRRSAPRHCLRNYSSSNTPRRALLYIPGDDDKKLTKSLQLDVDCVAMDCEDGVAINKKEAARSCIKKILDAGKPQKSGEYDWAVRVNSVRSGLFEEDLNYVLGAKHLPDTILLPKVESVDDLKFFYDKVNTRNAKINLIFYIESAMAMLNMVDICKFAQTSTTIQPAGIVFGSDDFCADIGATRTDNSEEILFARQKVVLTAKAFKMQAIDMVHIQYKDLVGLKRNSEQGARMGFTGKQVIHPGQIEIVQTAFLPNARDVEWAKQLLIAFEDHQKTGKGAFTFRGSMIDMPTMKQAKNVINLIKSR